MKKAFIYTVVIILFFVLGIVVANFLIMPLIVHMGKEVAVPNVCNLPLEKAIQELKKKNLEGVVVERRYDQIIEEGKVIVQEPLPNDRVKEGRIINLTVSLGTEILKIPYLIGVDVEKGKSILRKLGFTIETIEFVLSDSIAKNKIIQTVPEAEVELKKGDAVKLIVSKGEPLKMPNLTGKNIDDVKIILKKLGLVLGEIKEVEGSDGNKGSIIVQHPAPEQIVKLGDTVTVMVIK
jgi:beta-lactam-binding protein with PASTA domain